MKYLNNKIQLGVLLSNKLHEQTEPVNLRPDHVLGVFAAWSFGMLLATAVFIIEILTKHYENTKMKNNRQSITEEPTPGFSGAPY